MRYTVVVKEFRSSNGDYDRKRYNNVSKRIIKFLLKYDFCFMKGIAKYIAGRDSAKNYVEIFAKSTIGNTRGNNYYLNKKLYNKLEKLSKKK